jgi:hypothetical protein
MHVEQGNACAVSWMKSEGERPLGKPRIIWGTILKWVLNIRTEP